MAADGALVLRQAVARSHDTVRAFACGVRAADHRAPTLAGPRSRLGPSAPADMDVAAPVAMALVHATRLPARRLVVREDPGAREASASPQGWHRVPDDIGIRGGRDVSRRHDAVTARLVCAGRDRTELRGVAVRSIEHVLRGGNGCRLRTRHWFSRAVLRGRGLCDVFE